LTVLDRLAGRLWGLGVELVRRAERGARLALASPRWWSLALALSGIFVCAGLMVMVAALVPWSGARVVELTTTRHWRLGGSR